MSQKKESQEPQKGHRKRTETAGIISQMNDDNTTVMLFPGWCFETLSAAFLISTPPMNQQQAENFIMRLRDTRLLEVDELEKILGIDPTTAEIRREYKALKRRMNSD